MALKSHKELDVWNKAMELVVEIYRLTSKLPKEERYGMVSQMQRAAVSVPANIAEGYGRTHRGDYLHHLSFAMGSAQEVDTLIELIIRLKYLTAEEARVASELTTSAGKMLNRLIYSLQSLPTQPRSPRP